MCGRQWRGNSLFVKAYLKQCSNFGGNMNLNPRIFISAPIDASLTSAQLSFKTAVIKKVKQAGFDPQEFNVSGLPIRDGWTFQNVENIMERCQGAIILAFERYSYVMKLNNQMIVMPTEYNHYEGALALTLDKETLIIKEDAVSPRGIADTAGGSYIVSIPQNAKPSWVNSNRFKSQFNAWVKKVEDRHHVFFGYSSKVSNTALQITSFLRSMGVKVRDWRTDFKSGGIILDEIEESAKKSLGGIFLFTKDDDLLIGDEINAAPRDNVVFEVGYFMYAVGKERTLIIREKGAKMPADVGGAIYLDLKNKRSTASIETALRKFIDDRI
jgi:hypothetical protein